MNVYPEHKRLAQPVEYTFPTDNLMLLLSVSVFLNAFFVLSLWSSREKVRDPWVGRSQSLMSQKIELARNVASTY